MPVVSQAQNRFFRAKENAPGRIGEVAREFIGASHGMSIKKLPQHVSGKKPKPVPGSLAPGR